MTKEEFHKMQYEALRQEILATQRRNLQTLGFGALSVPAVSYLADVHKIPALALTIPPLVLGIALFYLADNHGIIRCGEYIKEHIEKDLAPEGVMGWETWLEAGQEHGTRSTERYTTVCFYLLFLLYFVTAIFMAWSYMESVHYRFGVAVGIAAFYSALGAGVGWYIVHSLRLGTTRYDNLKLGPARGQNAAGGGKARRGKAQNRGETT